MKRKFTFLIALFTLLTTVSCAPMLLYDGSGTSTSQETESVSSFQYPEIQNVPSVKLPVSSSSGNRSAFNSRDIKKLSFSDPVNGRTLVYTLIMPDDYDESKQYPVVFYLHGAGEMGNDNQTHLGNMVYDLYTYNEKILSSAFMLCPQCPSGGWWSLDTVNGVPQGDLGSALRILSLVTENYSCDEDRIYVMGLSMGGYATWTLLQEYGDMFAAGVPICGWGDISYSYKLKDIPIWIYHGTADTTVDFNRSKEMYDAIISAGGTKVHFTELPGVEHNAWDYAEFDSQMIKWLFSQNLADRRN